MSILFSFQELYFLHHYYRRHWHQWGRKNHYIYIMTFSISLMSMLLSDSIIILFLLKLLSSPLINIITIFFSLCCYHYILPSSFFLFLDFYKLLRSVLQSSMYQTEAHRHTLKHSILTNLYQISEIVGHITMRWCFICYVVHGSGIYLLDFVDDSNPCSDHYRCN